MQYKKRHDDNTELTKVEEGRVVAENRNAVIVRDLGTASSHHELGGNGRTSSQAF